jgi:hypothetical protein
MITGKHNYNLSDCMSYIKWKLNSSCTSVTSHQL